MYPRRMSGPTWPLAGGRLRPPADLVALLGVLFVTFVLQFFAATAALPAALRLTPAVWTGWQLWRLVSYPFAGFGLPDLWFVLELVILFFFARDVRARLGARRFWSTCVGVGALAGAAACLAALAWPALAHGLGMPFQLMQGQRLLMAVMLAAFGALAPDAVVYLFFVLPVRARYFPLVGLVLAFVAFLATRDLPGLVGVAAATGATWMWLRPGSLRRWRLKVERGIAHARLRRLERRRGWRVLDGGRGGPTIH